ncbi:MAG: nicotinate-nucleotide--dimethylbenzimidazole phosphoribosyltransferase [Actinomycetota bacterium]|nr:nicotinate-nucleotide--dimethylbenzimidazole phosphoribosyltransferase [Actinomycetota bacterium]
MVELVTGLDDVDAILFDIGGTLVAEASPGTAVADLEPRAFEGVPELLRSLAQHHRLGAVTNTAVMREADVRALLTTIGIDDLLEVVVTSSDVGAEKPDPAPLLHALQRMSAEPGRTLYVGDRDIDREAAHAAGLRFAATDRGVGDALDRVRLAAGGAFATAAAAVAPLDERAMAAAAARHDRLTKPPGSLGRLEALGVHLAGIAGTSPPPVSTPVAVAVFASDHGVVAAGVTPWPQDVTVQMVANFVRGGAAINAIAAQVGASVCVVDVGVAGHVSQFSTVRHHKVRAGTRDLSMGPAMTAAEARAALDAGAATAAALIAEGNRLLVTGDMGIGNTTASAAIIAALTGRSASDVTGRGTGIDDTMLAHKREIVAGAVARTAGWLDPVSVLSEVGGFEIAALAGFVVGGAAGGVPVLVDGVIALAGLLVADALVPGVRNRCIAGHRSTEPGATVALEHLGLTPLLELDLRLGEGTGACLAVPLVQAAARVLRDMATFEEAAVSERDT